MSLGRTQRSHNEAEVTYRSRGHISKPCFFSTSKLLAIFASFLAFYHYFNYIKWFLYTLFQRFCIPLSTPILFLHPLIYPYFFAVLKVFFVPDLKSLFTFSAICMVVLLMYELNNTYHMFGYLSCLCIMQGISLLFIYSFTLPFWPQNQTKGTSSLWLFPNQFIKNQSSLFHCPLYPITQFS